MLVWCSGLSQAKAGSTHGGSDVKAALGFLAWTSASSGPSAGEKWLDGYVMELVLSMVASLQRCTGPFAGEPVSSLTRQENIFLYHMILVSFKVPAKMARYALFLVSIFQMLFQMLLGFWFEVTCVLGFSRPTCRSEKW